MKRRKQAKPTGRREGRARRDARAALAQSLEAMADAMTTTSVIAGRACRCETRSTVGRAVRSLDRGTARLQQARSVLEPGAPLGPSLLVAVRTVGALLPILYERPEGLPTVIARAPVVRSAIVASMGPTPVVLAALTPADIEAILEALLALARALDEAAMDASPEDAAKARLLANRIALLIAALRSGATLAQIEAGFVGLIDEILAILTRIPPSVGRVVGARLMDVINLLTRLASAAAGSAWIVILLKALLAALVFLLAHLATRWVLEHCRYQGVRLWDLLDENPVFDWWYGVGDAKLSRCEKLYRAYLSYRRERRAAQAAGEDADIISILAGTEARLLGLWIFECVDGSQKPFWERELARVRALI